MPSQATIAEIEASLPHVLDSVFQLAFKDPRLRPDRSVYYRQYIGIRRWTGKQTVYINAFHQGELLNTNKALAHVDDNGDGQPDTLRWRADPFVACDGGTRFLGVEYDPRTRRYGRVHFNDRVSGPVTY